MFEKLANIIRWIPVLWKYDQPYAVDSMLPLLKYKLKRFEAEMNRTHAIWRTSEKEKLYSYISLIDKLMKDEFIKNETNAFYKEYGKPDLKPADQEHPNLVSIDYSLADTKEKKAAASIEYAKLLDLEDQRKHQARLKLFMLLANNMHKWWV